MNVVGGLVLIALSLLAWGGQTIVWLAPTAGERLGLAEAEDDVDATYWADIRGEAAWDAATLWTLLLAGVLLVVDHDGWAYFGLVGGGMYIYFAGRGIVTRREMLRRGRRIGSPESVRTGIVALVIWGVAGAVTVAAATSALAG